MGDQAATGSASRRRFAGAMARVGRQRWFRFLLSAGTLFSQRRVVGLSAEAAFWATFTLPWIALGLVAAMASVASWLGSDITIELRSTILDAASRVLTQDSIDGFLVPLVDSTLQGSTTITVIGFLAALWSGSRIFATFVEGSQVLNGRTPAGYVVTRGIAVAIFAMGVVGMSLLVLTVVKFPQAWGALLGFTAGGDDLGLVLVGLPAMIIALTTLLYFVDPQRTMWRYEVPGGCLSVALWLLGSYGLSLYFQWLFRAGSVYGAIAAPIAVMLWALVSVLAVFVGMTCNAALRLARRGLYLKPSDPSPYATAVPATTPAQPDEG